MNRLYLKDYILNFENICERLDSIGFFDEKKSVKSRLIEFHSLLGQLKVTLFEINKLQNIALYGYDDLKDKILKYENQLKMFICLNINTDYKESRYEDGKALKSLKILINVKKENSLDLYSEDNVFVP